MVVCTHSTRVSFTCAAAPQVFFPFLTFLFQRNPNKVSVILPFPLCPQTCCYLLLRKLDRSTHSATASVRVPRRRAYESARTKLSAFFSRRCCLFVAAASLLPPSAEQFQQSRRQLKRAKQAGTSSRAICPGSRITISKLRLETVDNIKQHGHVSGISSMKEKASRRAVAAK